MKRLKVEESEKLGVKECGDLWWNVYIILIYNDVFCVCGLLYSLLPHLDGRIILKWILEKWDEGGRMDWIYLAQDRWGVL